MIEDAKRTKVDFIVFCGDIERYGRRDPFKLARTFPIFYVHGDHDFFYQWSESGSQGRIPHGKLDVGGHNCPIAFILGNNTEWQARVGPYFWSMTYKGIHFIFDMNQKFLVYGAKWYLEWLKRDLREHKEISTVMFTHRPPTEDSPTFEKIRNIVRSSENLVSIVYAHVHAPRLFSLLGRALLVSVELDKSPVHPDRWAQVGFEGISKTEGWYGLMEISKSGVDVYAKHIGGEKELRYRYRIKTTFSNSGIVSVKYPFIVGDKSMNIVDLSGMRNLKCKIYGVRTAQLIPEPDISNSTYWILMKKKIKLSVADCESKGRNAKLPSRCLILRQLQARDTMHTKNTTRLAKIELKGIDTVNRIYTFMMIVRKARQTMGMMLEAYDKASRLLVRFSRECPNPKDGVSFCTIPVGSTAYEISPGMHSSRGWIWLPTLERIYRPMESSRIVLYVITSQSMLKNPAYVNVLCFPQEGWFSNADYGQHTSENVTIKIDHESVFLGNLQEGQCMELPKRILSKRNLINLKVRGSGLAIVEFTGLLDLP
jgi:hypothetical protein